MMDTHVSPYKTAQKAGTPVRDIQNKWKNHFSEMKGDVGMSLHEKEGEQEDA